MILSTKAMNLELKTCASSRKPTRVKRAVTAKVISLFCLKLPKRVGEAAGHGGREALWTAETCLRFAAEPACWRGGRQAMHRHKLGLNEPGSHRRRQASMSQSGNKLPQSRVLRTSPNLPFGSSDGSKSYSSFCQKKRSKGLPANTVAANLYSSFRLNHSCSA